MDSWDPRKKDYKCPFFNSYDRGPGRYLPTNSSSRGVKLYIRGIPNEVTEEGIHNMFVRAGTVTHVKKCVSNKETGDTFGFVTMGTLSEAEEAIRQYDQFKLGQFTLKVSVAESKEDRFKRAAEKKEEEEFLETLQSFKTNEKPTSNSDAGSTKVQSGKAGAKPLGGGGDAGGSKGAGRGRILHQLTATSSGDTETTKNDQHQSDSGKKDKKADVASLYSVENLKITTGSDEKKSVAGTGSVAVVLRKQFDGADTESLPPQGTGRGVLLDMGGRVVGRGREWHGQRGNKRRQDRRGHTGRGYRSYNNYDFYEESRPGYSSTFGYPQPQQPALIDPRMAAVPYIGMPMGYTTGLLGPYPAVQNPYLLQTAPMATPMPRPEVMNSTINYGNMPDTSMAADTSDKGQQVIGLCSACGRSGHMRCSRCKAPYCSEKCQAHDWSAHKKVCMLLQKEHEVENAFDIEVGDDLIPVMKHLVEKHIGEPLEIKTNTSKSANPQSPKPKMENDPSGKQNAGQSANDRSCRDSNHGHRSQVEEKQESVRRNDHGDMRGKCYNCHQEGHVSRGCPQRRPRGDRADRMESLDSRTDLRVEVKNGLDRGPTRQLPGKPVMEPKVKVAPSPVGFNVKPPMLVEFTPFPLHKEVQVAVTEVTSPSQVWVQLVHEHNINALAEMMSKLSQLYTDSPPNMQAVSVGEIYAAQFSDGGWYRAKVVATRLEKIKVHYIDFGNDDVTTTAKLRHLDPDLLKFQAQAIALSIAGVSPPGSETEWTISQDTLQAVIPANVVYQALATTCRTSSDGWLVYMVKMTTDSGVDVAEKLVSMGVAESAMQKTPPKQKLSESSTQKTPPKQKSKKAPKPASPVMAELTRMSPQIQCAVATAKDVGSVAREVKVGQELQVTLTHATTPATFTVQIIAASKIEAFTQFNEKLNTLYNESVDAHRPTQIGQLVVAKFSGDAGWFRGEIIQLHEKHALVYYIDFGNSEEVKFNDIRKALPFVISELPAQAIKCELFGLETQKEWNDLIIQKFTQLSDMQNGGAVKSVVKSVTGDMVTLDLFSKDGKSVGAELARVLSPNTDTKDQPGVTVNVPVADSSTKTLALPSDSASVVDVHQAQVEINPTMLPLNGTEVMATVSFVYGMDSFFLVHHDGQIQQQLNAMMAELNQMCNQSKTAYSAGEGEFVAAQFTDEGITLWYRARVVTVLADHSYRVLFVDYGNSETVTQEAVRRLDPRLAKLPQAAIHCRLPSTSTDPEVQEVFRGILNTPFKVKATRTSGDVYVVELYLEDGKNLVEMLIDGGETINSNENLPPAPLPVIEILKTVNMPMDSTRVDAETMAIENLSLFYVTLQDTDLQTQLSLLMSTLNTKPGVDGGDPLYAPVPGEYIAAQYTDPSGTTLWYRAQLTGKVAHQGDKIYQVFYVDYGNTDVISQKSIRRLDVTVKSVPLMAVPCQLAGYDESKHAEKNQDFLCILNQPVTIKVVSEEARTENRSLYDIEMFLPDTDKTCVNVVLFPEYKLSTATSVVKSEPVASTVAAVKNSDCISRRKSPQLSQPSKCVVELSCPAPTSVEKEIATNSTTLTAAKSGIENVIVPKSVAERGMMPDSVTENTVVAENQSVLPVNGSCVDVVLAHMENLGCFYVQLLDVGLHQRLVGLAVELTDKFRPATGGYQPVTGETVAAQYSEGDEVIWYRARCLHKVTDTAYRVHFLDYGNTETVNTDAIQKLDPKFCTLPFMSIKCCLVGSTGLEPDETVNRFRDFLNCQMKVTVQKLVKDMYHVELYSEGKSVHDILGMSRSPPSPKAVSPRPSIDIVSQLPKAVTPKKEALPRKVVSPGAQMSERKVVFSQTMSRHTPAEGAELVAVMTNVSSPGLFHCQQATPELLQALELLNQMIKLESEAQSPSAGTTYQIGELCCAQFPEKSCACYIECSRVSSSCGLDVCDTSDACQFGTAYSILRLAASVMLKTQGHNKKTSLKHHVPSNHDGQWYRACVKEVFPDETLQVEFVDYGNQAIVPTSLLRPVTNDYVELPIMAFKCSLYGVKPVSGSSWNEGAATTLAKFTERPLDAHIITVTSDLYEMELFDSQQDVSIGEHLIASNLAKSSLTPTEPSSATGVSDMDLMKQQNEMLQQQLMQVQKQMTQLMAHVTKQ